MTNTDEAADIKARMLDAAAMHVPFDGWSDTTFKAAMQDADVAPGLARAAFPRGAVDLALAFHDAGDKAMAARLEETDQSSLRYSERVTLAVRTRLGVIEDKEMVRRGMTLFALPQYAGDGAQALWRTADLIWATLGDTSRDVNWYTKRATLSGVYGATVLYWLGDESEGHLNTWAFLDRRIEDVMRIEKLKAQARDNRVLGGLMKGQEAAMNAILDRLVPQGARPNDMPGRWSGPV
ncbi:MAG: COQ9 family protein [Pseudomonadota bacterium]